MTWARPVPVVGDTTSAAQRAADVTGWRMGQATRDALYEVIAARRDIRRFRPDPVGPELVERLLGAAHMGPSVGHSQPWRFVLVRSPGTRERAALIAERERQRQAALFTEDARRRVLDLQLEGIREAPVGVVVCCDRRVAAAGVIGRATFPDTDLWSCACAIENLWLAARAEGLGVGWVTLFPPGELAELIGLPERVETLGWLCVGWPDERPPAPGLERAGWSRRAPLSEVVMEERWAGSGPPPPASALRAPGQVAVVGARDEADILLTPPSSLGTLDKALERLAALGVREPANASLVLVAADHPVTRYGVSTYPKSVTREVLEATVAGQSLGAAAARATGIAVTAVDAGVEGAAVPGAIPHRPGEPQGDLVETDALSLADAEMLVGEGRRLGRELDATIVVLGEAGVGNTTVAAALASAWLGVAGAETVGLGAGGDSTTLSRKTAVVDAALLRARGRTGRDRPVQTLAALGGPEFAFLTGLVLGASERGAAVILDGLATSVAALGAVLIEPGAAWHLVAGQRSREKVHQKVLEELGLEALLDLRVRAGEGVGAVLSYQLLSTGLAMRGFAGRVTP